MNERRSMVTGLVALCAALAACDPAKDRPKIEFTRAAMQSLPSVDAGGSGAKAAAVRSAPATVAEYPSLANLFKLECQHLPDTNYCPPTVAPTLDLMDPTRFEMGSLIGMIFHAQLYAGTLVTSCSGDGYSPAAISAGSYAAHTSAGSDPTRFVLDTFSLFTCRDSSVDSATAETRVVSAVEDGSYQAALHTRYAYSAGGQTQTDLFQVYVGMSGETPSFLAFNFASAVPHAERVVLLVNLVDHRFALKYYVPSNAYWAVAAGVGGYDLATGAANPGFYQVAFSDHPGAPLCVNNVGGVIQPEATECAAASVPSSWTSSDTIRDYLGIADPDAARVGAFLDRFGDATPLGPADAWQAPGDEDLYWPAAIR